MLQVVLFWLLCLCWLWMSNWCLLFVFVFVVLVVVPVSCFYWCSCCCSSSSSSSSYMLCLPKMFLLFFLCCLGLSVSVVASCRSILCLKCLDKGHSKLDCQVTSGGASSRLVSQILTVCFFQSWGVFGCGFKNQQFGGWWFSHVCQKAEFITEPWLG